MRRGRLGALGLLILLTGIAGAGEGETLFTEESLPPGWSIRQTIEVPAAQLAGFAGRLGGDVARLRNQVLDLNGVPARFNEIRGATEADATKIEQTMLGMRGADYVARRGANVYEVAGDNLLVARRVRDAAGIPAATTLRYRVRLRLALVDEVVESDRNDVFNLFLQLQRAPGDDALEARIRERTADWTFGDTLRLRASAWPATVHALELEPEPVAHETAGRLEVYRFEDAPRLAGVPYVTVVLDVEVASAFEARPGEAPEALAQPTATWPAAEIADFARQAAGAASTPREQVLALLRALAGRVRYGGKTGSRDPVPEVFARGYGHCFDKSDVLVAGLRSLGLPARVVAGWLPPLRSGHVWAEVFLEGEGWIPVDATTTWLGASVDYVPLFETSTGPMPFLYLAWPEIEPVD